ncbi:cytochrome P450 [Hypoxylon sp. FL1150]|nr:cytochrome P450 [Hypoxylon sp. FL1150]
MILDLERLSLAQVATVWPLVLGLGSILILSRSIYRLFFHPLSHIPGPKLAALSRAYEFYYDVVCRGMYIWKIEEMHKKYGPVVRISPREVHISDPYFYDEVYAPSGRKREKDRHFVGIFGFPTSVVATIPHELHRIRRGILNNFFSRRSVMALSSIILEKQAQLTQRLEEAHERDGVVRLDDGYAALTADIIAQYCWGTCPGFLEDQNFRNDIRAAISEVSAMVHVNRFFPILASLPRWVMTTLQPNSSAVLDMQDMVTASSTEKSDDGVHRTIFDALKDPSVPSQERSAKRLEDEGMIVLIAGTETTARALSMGSYYIYQDKAILQRLRDEIRTVMPTPTSEAPWSELEQLPYMNAVINESLRISLGPTFRSTRVAPAESLKYKDLIIPPGTPVSMCTYFVHNDPNVFPDPESFKPERWIEATEKGEHLNRFLVAFSRGSRACLGLNLAYAELYMTLATIVRRFDIDIYETGLEDIRIGRDMGVAQPKVGGDFKVRVKITKIITE